MRWRRTPHLAGARARARVHLRGDEALRGGAVRERRELEWNRDRLGAGGVCRPPLRADAFASSSAESRAGGAATATRSCSTTARASREADALYLAPAEPTKVIAVHLTYRSRIVEYDARTPAEPSYFMMPPTALNGHRRPVFKAAGSRFVNYEGELAVVVGRAHEGRADRARRSTTSPATRAPTTSACTTSATPTAARCCA